jgi:hypothetical protein
MRLDRTRKRFDRSTTTFLVAALATSAIVMILTAAPATSTAGSPARPPAHVAPTRLATTIARSPIVANAPASMSGSPIQEAAVMRAAAADRRHDASRTRLHASTSHRQGSAPAIATSGAPSRGGSVHDLIVALFGRIAGAGQVSTALCIANRESHFDPYARNPYSSAAGVFQWVASSWRSYSARYGFGGTSVFDAYANIAVAAHAVASGGWGPWGGGCW